MKNKNILIKRLCVCMLVFLLCGCTAKYDLTIKNERSITEVISVSEGKATFKNYAISKMFISDKNNVEAVDCSNISIEQCKEELFDMDPFMNFDGEVDDFLNKLGMSYEKDILEFNEKMKKQCNVTNENFDVVYTNSNINYYNENNLLISKIADIYSITNENNIINININSLKPDFNNKADEIQVRIIAPFENISNNANSITIDNDNYIYIWNFRKNDFQPNITLSLDTTKTIAQEKQKKSIIITSIIAGSIVIIVTILLLVISVKNKKNNKF